MNSNIFLGIRWKKSERIPIDFPKGGYCNWDNIDHVLFFIDHGRQVIKQCIVKVHYLIDRGIPHKPWQGICHLNFHSVVCKVSPGIL